MAWIQTGIVFTVLLAVSLAQVPVYKICATDKYFEQCNQMQRGKSEVLCQRVQDSIECAKRLLNQTADFGIFSAENTLHLATLGWTGITVVKRMAHVDRLHAPADFESVVVVRKDYKGGLEGLKGKKFCHPGLHYGKAERWSEKFQKHFERNVVTSYKCVPGQSAAEVEAAALAAFFGPSCRPGRWSHDLDEDAELKRKYPSLCELCYPGSKNCDYPKGPQGPNSNHQRALECLRGGGDVAYVSREDAEHFFAQNDEADFQYLCPNGTVESLANKNNPCVWLRQPWSVIIATSEKAVIIDKKIDQWRSSTAFGIWQNALKEILEADSHVPVPVVAMQLPSEYMALYRRAVIPDSICDTNISWCTTSPEEYDKCNVVRAAGISAGLFPLITCRDPLLTTMECLRSVSENQSDFMGIDSNYGFMARRLYNLTAAMYFETEVEQYSSPVVVIHANSKIKKFTDLKNAKACLPEFGATPTIAFINTGKERKFFKRNECRYSKLLRDFFGASCAPGATDIKRDLNKRDLTSNHGSTNHSESLCTLCLNEHLRSSSYIGMNVEVTSGIATTPIPNKVTCSPDESNRYFGNRGALRCLHESGDVAIVELQSLKDHASYLGLNEKDFRIICRDGSLAAPGFDVDLSCALTTIVDGEIVVRRGTPKLSSVIGALNAFDLYFQGGPDFKMYNIYDGQKHLLFKDSTIGLTSVKEKNMGKTVENYIKLFKNTEDCVQGNAALATVSLTTTIALTLMSIFMSY